MRVERLAAFTRSASGGNPAGVVITDALPDPAEMQRVATEVGYSETAFLSAGNATPGEWDVRYFSPRAEVPFCGHATIAAGVVLGERHGPGRYVMSVADGGRVAVDVRAGDDSFSATLTSVRPEVRDPDVALADAALAAMGWDRSVLDAAFPAACAFAGAWHLMLGLRDRAALSRLSYDFGRLGAVMRDAGLTTIHVFWRQYESRYAARNPFPVGGVVEDPATGAAAAAFGAYLRHYRLVDCPARIEIVQGEDMGRPSLLVVDIPEPVESGIQVTGHAVRLARAGSS